jgi:ribonuclease T
MHTHKTNKTNKNNMQHRFRGYLPVVVDVETAGFTAATDALLELAAVTIIQDEHDNFVLGEAKQYHIEPFPNAILNQECLEFNKIDPYHPFRFAVTEHAALTDLFGFLNNLKEQYNCNKCVLVGHNAWFDLSFVNAAAKRAKIKKNPFHSFTAIDTASLAAVFYGHTVLASALKRAKIPFNVEESHSALYDATKTAELFCKIVNNSRL